MTAREPVPDYLYLYKYVPFDRGSLCILTRGTLKFTNPLDFNDPFDCFPTFNTSLQHLRKRDSQMMDAFVSPVQPDGKRLSPAKQLRRRSQAARMLQRRVDTDGWREQVVQRVGVLSLSAVPDDILMWSHYADLHTGFVVGFRIPYGKGRPDDADQNGLNLIPHKMNYSQTRPMVNLGTDSKIEQVKKVLMTKSIHWEYEAEHRVIDVDRGAGIHPYNQERALDCVITGMRMRERNVARLNKVVSALKRKPGLEHLELFQAEASKRDYALEIPGLNAFREARDR